jgi:hypothetical protein
MGEMMKPMLTKIYRDFRHSFMERLMHFELSNSGLGNDVAVIKTFMMIFVLEDLLWMISMQSFSLYSTKRN